MPRVILDLNDRNQIAKVGPGDTGEVEFNGSVLVLFPSDYYNPEMVVRMAHFAAAFFGTHLQRREDLSYYFSEDFVALHDDLAWGVYEDE